MFYSDTSRCEVCGNNSSFIFEWYGYDQHGENKEVIYEIGVCANFGHMVEAFNYGKPGGDVPDDYPSNGIVDERNLDVEYPSLVFHLENTLAFKKRSKEFRDECRRGQVLVDMILEPVEQGKLFEN